MRLTTISLRNLWILSLSFAIAFLAVSVFLWVSLGLYAIGIDKIFITGCNSEDYYRVALIATSIAFGLFTVSFSIVTRWNEVSNQYKEKRNKTNEYLSNFVNFCNSPAFQYVYAVCSTLVDSVGLETIFNETKINGFEQTFSKKCIDVIANSKINFVNEMISSASSLIHYSTSSGGVPNWYNPRNNNQSMVFEYFLNRFVSITNEMEALSYPCLNFSIDVDAVFTKIKKPLKFIFLVDQLFFALGLTDQRKESLVYVLLSIHGE